MNKVYLYHVTDCEKIPELMQDGLRPRVGINSSVIRERSGRICLTDAASAPYWSALLGRDALLRVDMTGIPFETVCNSRPYVEHIVKKTGIPAQRLEQVPLRALSRHEMSCFCQHYIGHGINKFYQYMRDAHVAGALTPDSKTAVLIRLKALQLFLILGNLDFSSVTAEEFWGFVRQERCGGNMVFTDYIAGVPCYQFYEHVCDDPILKDYCQRLRNWIDDNLPLRAGVV